VIPQLHQVLAHTYGAGVVYITDFAESSDYADIVDQIAHETVTQVLWLDEECFDFITLHFLFVSLQQC
jgi:hypothetical protein